MASPAISRARPWSAPAPFCAMRLARVRRSRATAVMTAITATSSSTVSNAAPRSDAGPRSAADIACVFFNAARTDQKAHHDRWPVAACHRHFYQGGQQVGLFRPPVRAPLAALVAKAQVERGDIVQQHGGIVRRGAVDLRIADPLQPPL